MFPPSATTARVYGGGIVGCREREIPLRFTPFIQYAKLSENYLSAVLEQ